MTKKNITITILLVIVGIAIGIGIGIGIAKKPIINAHLNNPEGVTLKAVAVEQPRLLNAVVATATLGDKMQLSHADKLHSKLVNKLQLSAVKPSKHERFLASRFDRTKVVDLNKELKQVKRFDLNKQLNVAKLADLNKKLKGFDLNDQLRLVKTSPLELAQLELFS